MSSYDTIMRIVSGLLFWLGLLIAIVVATLALVDNGIAEVLSGLMFAPERETVAVGGAVGFLLIGSSLAIRRYKRLVVPGWRIGALAVSLIGTVLLSLSALHPGFSTVDVGYESEGVVLRATLYLPDSSERLGAMALVPGSAPFRRDFYDVYARRLAALGYIVLLPDKRGAGESGGTFVSDNNGSLENLSLLARDVVAGVSILAHHRAVDPRRIGLFGISQAGWVAPLAADASPLIRYMVLVTAPTVSVGEEGVWSDLRGDDEADPIAGFAQAERTILATDPSGFDPRETLGRLSIPALWLFGDIDNSIPSAKSIAVLEALPEKANDYIVYPGYGHILIGKGSGRIYDVAPESWQDIRDWLAQVAPPKK